jgi:hypothetical protein
MSNMFQGKVRSSQWLPVRMLLAADDSAVTGIAASAVTVGIALAPAAETTFTPSAADWIEQARGNYWLRNGADKYTAAGPCIVRVSVSACNDYYALVDVAEDPDAAMVRAVEQFAEILRTATGQAG